MHNTLRFVTLLTCSVLSALSASRGVLAADVLIPTNQIAGVAQSRLFILSIGTNNYRDAFWPTLKWPASDATRVSDQIGTSTHYHVTKKLLLNEYATRENIFNAMQEISTQAMAQDAVVLYVSGHGTLVQTAQGELERVVVAHDSLQNDLIATGVSHQYLNHWLESLQARKKLMIFATCHSGEGKSRLPENVKNLFASSKGELIALSDASEGALVLAAVAKGETAHENDNLQGDIYTHYLLEALKVYDRNRDGMVSAMEAHDYARERTWAFSQGRQRPTANIKQIGDADLPLYGSKSSSGLPVLQAYDDTLSGFYVQIDNGAKGRLPFAFPLNSDGSTVALYAPGGTHPIARYKVSASDGQAISLNSVMHERPVNFGLLLRRFEWQHTSWQKLTGETASNTSEIYMAYQYGQIGFGLLVNSSVDEEGEGTLREPINTDVKLESQLLFVNYKQRSGRLQYAARLEIGRESVDVALYDKSVNETIKTSDATFSKGIAFSAGYMVAADLYVTLEAGMRDTQWELNPIGKLDGERHWVGLGIEYRFGWTARTLW